MVCGLRVYVGSDMKELDNKLFIPPVKLSSSSRSLETPTGPHGTFDFSKHCPTID
jgi:hypothetical protein